MHLCFFFFFPEVKDGDKPQAESNQYLTQVWRAMSTLCSTMRRDGLEGKLYQAEAGAISSCVLWECLSSLF